MDMLLMDTLALNNVKIAVVKSNIYQDLWVSDITSDIQTIFKSSLMRCSPIGLCEKGSVDFIIVKESCDYPCKVYTFVPTKEEQKSLKYSKEIKNVGLPFLDSTYHKHTTIDEVSHNVDDIDWNIYNIVITMNACIPDRIIALYPSILWCYYISENEEHFLKGLIGNYDLLLNQDIGKDNSYSIGFPYTYLGSHTLENVYSSLFGEESVVKKGIFMEINNVLERPVRTIPDSFLHISNMCSLPIFIHNQNIVENLKIVCQCSYFVKLHGRVIRGNGVLEAISCGTLVLMNKNLIMYSDLIPDECHVENVDDVIRKINAFESDTESYNKMVAYQRSILGEKYCDRPICQLYERYCLKNMKSNGHV